jgi:hypothetical protein
MFEKSLQDLVKGLRAIKGDATGYIAKCIAEIRDELKSRDILIKTQALQKLCYVSARRGLAWPLRCWLISLQLCGCTERCRPSLTQDGGSCHL